LKILNPHAASSLKMIKDAGKIAEDLYWAGLKDFLNTPFEITNWLLLYLRDIVFRKARVPSQPGK